MYFILKMSFQNTNTLKEELIREDHTFILRKRNRKNEISWSFEEEFLFFEAHSFIGNKWKRYSQIIQK